MVGPFLAQIARYWWIELLLGAFWIVAAVVVLKSDQASMAMFGVLTRLMFLLIAAAAPVAVGGWRPAGGPSR